MAVAFAQAHRLRRSTLLHQAVGMNLVQERVTGNIAFDGLEIEGRDGFAVHDRSSAAAASRPRSRSAATACGGASMAGGL